MSLIIRQLLLPIIFIFIYFIFGNILECTNKANDNDCNSWAKIGECANNPEYMLKNCKKSCNNCGGGSDGLYNSTLAWAPAI